MNETGDRERDLIARLHATGRLDPRVGIGSTVRLPNLDSTPGKAARRYTVVKIRERGPYASGVAFSLNRIDMPQRTCVDLGHIAWAEPAFAATTESA